MESYKIRIMFDNGAMLTIEFTDKATRDKEFEYIQKAKASDSSVLVLGDKLNRKYLIDAGASIFTVAEETKIEEPETEEEDDENTIQSTIDFFRSM